MSLSVSLIFAQFRYIKELFLFTLKIIEEALEAILRIIYRQAENERKVEILR